MKYNKGDRVYFKNTRAYASYLVEGFGTIVLVDFEYGFGDVQVVYTMRNVQYVSGWLVDNSHFHGINAEFIVRKI